MSKRQPSGYCYRCNIVARIDEDDGSWRGYVCSQCNWLNVIQIPGHLRELFAVIFRYIRRTNDRLDALENMTTKEIGDDNQN